MKRILCRKQFKQRGATLVEVTTASLLSMLVFTAAISLFLFGMSTWYKGTSKIEASLDCQSAVRLICQELREAMKVDAPTASNTAVNYRMPKKNEDGDFEMDAQGRPIWDGISRSIYLSDGKIYMVAGSASRVLCSNVITTDPQSVGGATTYKIFNAGSGTIIRQMTVMLVTKKAGYKKEFGYSRSRESIYLRNIPELVR